MSEYLKEMVAQRKSLDENIAAEQQRVQAEVLQQVSNLLASVGMTAEAALAALVKKSKPACNRGASSKNPPKYRHTPSGATWTGKGRVPKWYAEGSPEVETLF